MDYKLTDIGVEVLNREDFNPKHILECGQTFRYQSGHTGYKLLTKDMICHLISKNDRDIISTNNPLEFVHFFDLNRDYAQIKQSLMVYPNLKRAIQYGSGIRILNQDPFEMILSFILSANNNIPRIKGIIEKLCRECGEKKENYNAFPTSKDLKNKTSLFFKEIGAGYRANYLVKTIDAINNGFDLDINSMCVSEARKHLMLLAGIGRKVADCVLLFGFHRTEVFPTDTWVEKIYDKIFGKNNLCANVKADILSNHYGNLSGYAQQYLFYYMRSAPKIKNNCITEDEYEQT